MASRQVCIQSDCKKSRLRASQWHIICPSCCENSQRICKTCALNAVKHDPFEPKCPNCGDSWSRQFIRQCFAPNDVENLTHKWITNNTCKTPACNRKLRGTYIKCPNCCCNEERICSKCCVEAVQQHTAEDVESQSILPEVRCPSCNEVWSLELVNRWIPKPKQEVLSKRSRDDILMELLQEVPNFIRQLAPTVADENKELLERGEKIMEELTKRRKK